MAGVSIDASEIRTLAVDMRRQASRMPGEVKQIVEKAAVEIKKDLAAQLAASKHFKGFARVSYDLRDAGFGAEIGPDKGGPGSGANIAYFGTSRGGGTVEDPVEALNREAPTLERYLSDMAAGLLS